MEGGGFYNRHSAMQAAGISRLLPYWEKAAREVDIDEGPFVIADYGSSQGRNSMAPMRIAIEELRARTGRQTTVEVIHTDLPSNDFAALFGALEEDPGSYMAGAVNIFPSAVGRSYVQPILPTGSVHLGWNTWTMHWLSGDPISAPDHFSVESSKSQRVVAALRQRLAEDWRRFLECRATELRTGGKLLTAFAAREADKSGWEWLDGQLWQAMLDLGSDGVLSKEEQLRVTMPVAGRSIDQIRAPFGESGNFSDLIIEQAEILKVPDPTWAAFETDRDAQKLGRSHANMMRAWSGPTISGILGARADKAAVLDKLFDRFAVRIAAAPQPHEPYLAVALLTKV
jgi:hypothetical protein